MNRWVAGARPRTLPAAVVPVLVGTGVAADAGDLVWWRAAAALLVALALQVGVNYANDYSDGVRGTDRDRVGPMRLVAGGVAAPRSVLLAALVSFVVAAAVGTTLVVATGAWWLFGVGLLAIAAAWTYTGGPRPYGYRALGELGVFVFFGLVAVAGTAYVQTEQFVGLAWPLAAAVGLLACALLMVNNIRDLPRDQEAGKRTLAVVLGAARARLSYGLLLLAPWTIVVVVAFYRPWLLLVLAALPLTVAPFRRVVRRREVGAGLVQALGETGRAQLAFGLAVTLALAISAS